MLSLPYISIASKSRKTPSNICNNLSNSCSNEYNFLASISSSQVKVIILFPTSSMQTFIIGITDIVNSYGAAHLNMPFFTLYIAFKLSHFIEISMLPPNCNVIPFTPSVFCTYISIHCINAVLSVLL